MCKVSRAAVRLNAMSEAVEVLTLRGEVFCTLFVNGSTEELDSETLKQAFSWTTGTLGSTYSRKPMETLRKYRKVLRK